MTKESQRELARRLLALECGHLPLRVLPSGCHKAIWSNSRFNLVDDVAIRSRIRSEEDYEAHIAQTCGYILSPDSKALPATLALADRYGGNVGANGGSGRAVIANGYYIKGVGRTPLVSSIAEERYSDGKCSLEEGIREVIFAEVLGQWIPAGVIPTLAVLAPSTPSIEMHELDALIVRPLFVRPAHFERSMNYVPRHPQEFLSDINRVERAFAILSEVCGPHSRTELFAQFWKTWATQLAFSYAHRIHLGATSTSNVSIDGRALDFGATTTYPSWATYSTGLAWTSIGTAIDQFWKSCESLKFHFAAYGHPSIQEKILLTEAQRVAMNSFSGTLCIETLYVAGIPRDQGRLILRSAAGALVAKEIKNVWRYYQNYRVDISEYWSDDGRWDFNLIWHKRFPRHLRSLRILLNEFVREADLERLTEAAWHRSRPLKTLYGKDLTSSIREVIARRNTKSVEALHKEVAHLVRTKISEARVSFQ